MKTIQHQLKLSAIMCDPATFRFRFTLPTAWKCARSLVNSQIHSKLGCRGERPLYLKWNRTPIDCLVLVSTLTITAGKTTTTTAITTTTTTTTTTTSYITTMLIIIPYKSPHFREPTFHYGFRERQPLIRILSLINPVQNFTTNFFKTDVSVIFKFRLPIPLDFPIKTLHARLICILRAICSGCYILQFVSPFCVPLVRSAKSKFCLLNTFAEFFLNNYVLFNCIYFNMRLVTMKLHAVLSSSSPVSV
jgi:hypothetical protein